MATTGSNKLVWMIFLALIGISLIKEYIRLKTTSAYPVFKKDLYMIFQGRFGNTIFQFTGAYSMVLAAGCQKMYFMDNGQSERIKMFLI